MTSIPLCLAKLRHAQERVRKLHRPIREQYNLLAKYGAHARYNQEMFARNTDDICVILTEVLQEVTDILTAHASGKAWPSESDLHPQYRCRKCIFEETEMLLPEKEEVI